MKCLRALDALRLGHAGDLEREGDVVGDGAPREGRLLLEHHADRGVRAGHGLARDRDAALVAVEQPADDVEQGRLAAAGRADHGEELARRDIERDVVDRGEHAFGRLEMLDDVVDHEQRRDAARAERCSKRWMSRPSGEPQRRCAPSPPAGEGWGGGSEFGEPPAHQWTTPTPNPSPQGGGEQTECGERAVRIPHHAFLSAFETAAVMAGV